MSTEVSKIIRNSVEYKKCVFNGIEWEVPSEPVEFVDLGLSVRWAKCNLGAANETERGNLYAWGEVETKDHYDAYNYKYLINAGTENWEYTKYNLEDSKTILESGDDAAMYILGNDWRMPTYAEMEELLDTTKVTREVVTKNGVQGWEFTSIVPGFEGNKLFLPMQDYGDWIGETIWGGEVVDHRIECGWALALGSDYVYTDDEISRYIGRPTRPVYIAN